MRLRGAEEEAYRKASPGFRNASVQISQSLSASLPEEGLEVGTEIETIWPNLMHPNITVPASPQAGQWGQTFLSPSTQNGHGSTSASELLPGQSHARSQCKPSPGGLLPGRQRAAPQQTAMGTAHLPCVTAPRRQLATNHSPNG